RVIEKSRADRNPALRQPAPRFFHRGFEQSHVFRLVHLRILDGLASPCRGSMSLFANTRRGGLETPVAYFRDASTFLPYSRALARISGSFSVRSFLSRM